jgi:conjugative transfer signal peptidase TraF
MELSRKQQRILLALFCVALTYSFALTVWDVLLSSLPGINFNPTSSIPRGLYRWTHEPIHHGIVISFPQPRHPGVAQFRLPFNAKYLLKYIAAMPGDTVKVTAAGVWINGRRWPNSQAQNPIAKPDCGRHAIAPGYVWAMGTSDHSFDSRYFGEVPISTIVHTFRPSPIFGMSNDELCNDTGASPNPCYLRPDSIFRK